MKYGAFEKKLGGELLIGLYERNFQLMPDNMNQWNFYKQERTYVDYIFIGKGSQWRPKMNCIGFSYARKLNVLEKLFQEFKDKSGLDFTFSFIPNDEKKAEIKRKCFSPELENDVELAMEHILSNITEYVIPEMNRLSDIKILNALENKTVEHNGLVAADDMWLRKLALAWAAQDPIYEDIYKYVNDMDEKLIAVNDEHQALYINYSIAFKQLYIKLNGLPKFENTLLI